MSKEKWDYEKAFWKWCWFKNLIVDRLDVLVPDPVEYSRSPERFYYEMALRAVDDAMAELEKEHMEEEA